MVFQVTNEALSFLVFFDITLACSCVNKMYFAVKVKLTSEMSTSQYTCMYATRKFQLVQAVADLHTGIKNEFNYFHQPIMIFIIDLTIKAEVKVLSL